ncbi:MAG: tetratricopeptide repeat protein [Candidatus Omnitrophica bacterium]|nr:tetratricopeptide repeat protein [Candidatus Omnitrophota bacterium]
MQTLAVTGAWCAEPSFADQKKEEGRQYYLQGKSLVASGQIDEALAYFQKAVFFDPSLVAAYNEAAIILTIKGQTERAKEMYLRSIAIAPSYPHAYSNLALVYEEEGDFPGALQCWRIRANLGSSDDPWTQVARRRTQELADAHPGVYEKVLAGQYSLETPQTSRPAQALSPADTGLSAARFARPERVTLFSDEGVVPESSSQGGAYALDYLARAKDHYANGEYVQALREATIAEYMDPSNQEISSFVQQIREAILQ